MVDTQAVAFWSYARIDDERERGRIVRLAQLVADEYGLITGDELRMFVDRHDLAWGEVWRERIAAALQSTTFFIPVATPTYFQRDECRRELWTFHSDAKALGVTDLIMPIIYQRIPDFTEDNPNDAIGLVARMHSEFFDAVRLEDEGSAAHRKSVHRLAERLAALTEQVASRPAVPQASDLSSALTHPEGSELNDTSPGTMDLMADLEPAIQEWLDLMSGFPDIMERINAQVNGHTAQLHLPENRSFARRIIVSKSLAQALEAPVDDLESFADAYAAAVQRIDPGVKVIIEVLRENRDTEDPEQARTLLESIVSMGIASRESVEKMQGFVAVTRQTQKLSRDLRPVLTRMNTAVMNVVDAQSLIDEWEREARSALT